MDTDSLKADEFLDCRKELFRLFERWTMTAAGQLNVLRTGGFLGNLLIEDRRRRLIKFAAHNKRWHL